MERARLLRFKFVQIAAAGDWDEVVGEIDGPSRTKRS